MVTMKRKHYNSFYVIFLMLGMMLIFTGFHNIDNSWNLHTVECTTGIDWTDANVFGSKFTVNQIYNSGWIAVMIGMIVFGSACVLYKP